MVQLLLSQELILDKVVLIDEHLHELSLRIVEVSLRVEAVLDDLPLIVDTCCEAFELDRASVFKLLLVRASLFQTSFALNLFSAVFNGLKDTPKAAGID